MKRVIGIGNALVDIMVRVPGEEMLKQFSLPKGSMQLVDESRSESVKNGTGDLARSVSSGGSVANTIHALGMLGASPGYIGSVGTDDTGDFFSSDLISAGVDPILFRRNCPTGTAVALVTPDSERTFATHLGAAVDLNIDELNEELFRGYDILYVEGYLIPNIDLVDRACSIAKALGMEVALDLSSYNIVDENLESFRKIVGRHVDILFANEDEARSFTGLEPGPALTELAKMCGIAVVKTGRDGSMIRRGEELVRVGIIDVNPVDTTGAGDMYAAGFLYGYCKGEPLDSCGAYGALLAGSVIENMGAKLPPEKWPSIKTQLNH